jgi:hypothetical protein
MIYDQYFSDFEFVDQTAPYCTIRVTKPTFAGVEVVIAKHFIVVQNDGLQEIKFDYDIVSVPEGIDTQTLEFTDLVKNIFMAILERELETNPIYVQAETTNQDEPEV